MTNRNPPLPASLTAYRGLSPSQREALIDSAKERAQRFTWAVKARNAAEVQRVTGGMGRDEFAALCVVLAEGIQPGSMRLAEVCRALQAKTSGGAA